MAAGRCLLTSSRLLLESIKPWQEAWVGSGEENYWGQALLDGRLSSNPPRERTVSFRVWPVSADQPAFQFKSSGETKQQASDIHSMGKRLMLCAELLPTVSARGTQVAVQVLLKVDSFSRGIGRCLLV
jgi:hypothetical protein